MGEKSNHQSQRRDANYVKLMSQIFDKQKPMSEGEYWYWQRQKKKGQKARLAGIPQKPGGGAGMARVKQAWKRTKDFNRA